jgi:2'-5' RNA ligase
MRSQLIDIMGSVRNARWQSDDQLHLTLRFIGEVDRHQAEDIATCLATVDHPRPTLALNGTGYFAQKGLVHSLWARIAADGALAQLHDRVERAVRNAGVRPETRAFTAHITVARLGRDAGPIEHFLARTAALAGPAATLDAFILFESILGKNGASYETIARYPLR